MNASHKPTAQEAYFSCLEKYTGRFNTSMVHAYFPTSEQTNIFGGPSAWPNSLVLPGPADEKEIISDRKAVSRFIKARSAKDDPTVIYSLWWA